MSEHGTHARYGRGCRCPECTDVHRATIAEWRAGAKRALPSVTDDLPHGQSTYENWGCRCEVCTRAKKAALREYYYRKAESA